ncbi:hypothetical protein SEVIR_7G121600v4 [Setaria viridis]|uniref:Uncharacterized protein n=1 Tax=Setaria viridis TaxID=4556 RepID=A0A4U6TP82_SETVI|nr:hypothetical protein SEVIR_7G121600v2 [Setaria viridis]
MLDWRSRRAYPFRVFVWLSSFVSYCSNSMSIFSYSMATYPPALPSLTTDRDVPRHGSSDLDLEPESLLEIWMQADASAAAARCQPCCKIPKKKTPCYCQLAIY